MTDVETIEGTEELPGWLEEGPPVTAWQRGTITAAQYEMLMRPLREARVAKRSQGGKQLSYLEAWDVKAHLTRAFGFGNWDLEMLDYHFVEKRDYLSSKPNNAPDNWEPKQMTEVIYAARMQLTIRDPQGRVICRHSEGAVGSASGPANMLGEHHDNALKTAASDATKRCAINMGTQFGLSLYDNGSTREVIRKTVVVPEGYVEPEPTAEQAKALADSVGSVPDAEAQASAEKAAADGLGATKVEEPDSVPDGDGVRTA